jgi:hypothetical protein
VKVSYFSTAMLMPLSMMVMFYIGCSKPQMEEKEAQVVLNEFYTNKEPEPIVDQPLLSAGEAIVPYLMVEIQKKDMPRRGYAILALGKIGDRRALPILRKLFEDRSELVYFRDDALRAIWHIDRKLGEEYATKYVGESKEIDRTIELLRKGII